MADKESPVDVFKRALTAAARAVAHDKELSVTFGADVPTMQAGRVRLPLPARELPAQAVARARGAADGFALHLRHHDQRIHNALMPGAGPRGVRSRRTSARGSPRRATHGRDGDESRCRP